MKALKALPFINLLIILAALVVIFTSYLLLDEQAEQLEYCQSRGWQGVIHEDRQIYCYNETLHSSGTGKQIEKSGVITKEDWGKKS